MTSPNMPLIIAEVATGCAVLSFLTYLFLTFKPAPHTEIKQAIKDASDNVKGIAPVNADQIANMLKALASLVDSLVKAGPALWSLIGSILFLLVASVAARVIVGTADGSSTASNKTAANGTSTSNASTNASGNAATNTAAPEKPSK